MTSKRSPASSFARGFLRVYKKHRWPVVRAEAYSNRSWTQQMSKIIHKTALRLGLVERKDELKRIDFTYYRKGNPIPAVVVEHDNGWNVFDEEVPKLMGSSAQLRVLICYPPKRLHYPYGNKLLKLLNDSGSNQRTNEEFLLIMGMPTMLIHESSDFKIYWYHSVYRVNTIK